jgi:hypothetical protein
VVYPRLTKFLLGTSIMASSTSEKERQATKTTQKESIPPHFIATTKHD